ncbi:GNAT family N-acetyltransferase [Streptomyces montanisoli]|uniref:GNAT family N-acetyltransferase n=1 Tax=Streptomyces montanisoli TaxID=2798581 RepID=A0A940RY04_9ACTN|nr:GNAT family N-acetyltransferase [Streptomyces montanisoli]MBP0460866.1 GNAT family N-acetyltransferase [Streptomyces montanisoli]
MSTALAHPLDNPAWSALTGPHAHLAERHGELLRYPVEVSPWLALPTDRPRWSWDEIAAFAGPGETFSLAGYEYDEDPPAGWEVVFRADGVQMDGAGVRGEAWSEAVTLSPADVPDMLALVERTRPGPFTARTVELGTYLGIRRGGTLVAMAGERMHPPGWTEISAVCTDPEHRGQGLAGVLIRAVAAGIQARGDTPFLHAAAANTGAIRLYESLGFRLRRKITFLGVRVPS